MGQGLLGDLRRDGKGGRGGRKGFFAVLAVAGFLFERHRHVRAEELDAQLAQSAARLGREVELKYKNYRQVVDNLTRVMTQADSSAAAARQRDIEKAKPSQEQAREREKQLASLLQEAKKRREDALQHSKSAVTRDAAADDRKKACEDAEAAAEVAEKALTEATYPMRSSRISGPR